MAAAVVDPMDLVVVGPEVAVVAQAAAVALPAVGVDRGVPAGGVRKHRFGAVVRLKDCLNPSLREIQELGLRGTDQNPAGCWLRQDRCPPFPGAAPGQQF